MGPRLLVKDTTPRGVSQKYGQKYFLKRNSIFDVGLRPNPKGPHITGLKNSLGLSPASCRHLYSRSGSFLTTPEGSALFLGPKGDGVPRLPGERPCPHVLGDRRGLAGDFQDHLLVRQLPAEIIRGDLNSNDVGQNMWM